MNNNILYNKETDRFFFVNSPKIFNDYMPITLCYHIGYQCNLNCNYCISKNKTDIITSKGLSDYITYIASWKPLRVVISGGEPLIYSDRLLKTLRCLKENDIYTFISTNGILVKKEYNRIKGLVDWYDISLPAISRETYLKVRGEDRFEEVLNGIGFLVSNGEHVRLTFTINEYNIYDLLHFPEFALKHGIKNIRMGHTYSYEDGSLSNILWNIDHKNEISKYENKMKIYYPLSEEQLVLYNSGYIILENDGSMYKAITNNENFICNVSDVGKNFDTFREIGNMQMRLFADGINE